jgi:ADP-ribose pyrophosphatase YjhB (NUDIX family)
MAGKFRCVIHGSFSKHFNQISEVHNTFTKAGIEVLAPKMGNLTNSKNGFQLFEDEIGQDPRLIELIYLHKLKQLGSNGFSYFVNPDGYIGKSASYELAIAQLTNVRCFFNSALEDHPAYVAGNLIKSAQELVAYIEKTGDLPVPKYKKSEVLISRLWHQLMVPGSVVATGAIIEYQPKNSKSEKEVLLVKTHKWGDRYSIVGGKVKRNETLRQALIREVYEETNLRGEVGSHICTFDQIKNSGYYESAVQHIFVDNIMSVKSKKVRLNYEAQDYIWAEPSEALKFLDIEPNARQTLQFYNNLKYPASKP